MIYCFHGNDRENVRARVGKFVAGLKAKKPEANVISVDSENVDENRLTDLSHGQGLFEKSYIVVCQDLFGGESGEVSLGELSDMAESPNLFVLREGVLNKKIITALEKAGAKIEECKTFESFKKPPFNIFSLADALGKRDKKNLWILYRKAIQAGFLPEEISGTLFWQIKSLLLSVSSSSALEAGLKPFVWSRAKSFAKNYSELELKNLSWRIVEVYHSARRGIFEFETGLEKLILSL